MTDQPVADRPGVDRGGIVSDATFDADAAPELASGDSGEWVTYLQQLLDHFGFDGSGVTGSYDDGTEGAVRSLQQRARLEDTGRMDRAAWHALAQGGSREDLAHAAAEVSGANADQLLGSAGPLSTNLEDPRGAGGYQQAALEPGFPVTVTVVPESSASQSWATLDLTVTNVSDSTLDPVTYSWVASLRNTPNFVGEGSGPIGRMEPHASTALQVSHEVHAPVLGADPPIYQFIVMVFSKETTYQFDSHDEVRAYYSVSSDLTVAAERE